MHPAFSAFPTSMLVIFVPDTNSRRFRRILSTCVHAGNAAGAWARIVRQLFLHCSITVPPCTYPNNPIAIAFPPHPLKGGTQVPGGHAHDCRDAGSRATQEAKAEERRCTGYTVEFLNYQHPNKSASFPFNENY